MVKRTRGELPAVEPLVTPRWTAHPASAAAPEEVLEHEGLLRHDREANLPMHSPRLAAPQILKPERTAKLPAVKEDKRSAAGVSGGDHTIAPSPLVQKLAHDADHRFAHADLKVSHPLIAADSPQDSASPELRVLEVHMVNPAGAPSNAATETADKPSTALSPMRRKPQHAAKPPSPAISTRGDSAPGMDAAGEHTEIHITIGSIELHAPTAPAKAPPFRPRVSLDQFLNRRTGAAS